VAGGANAPPTQEQMQAYQMQMQAMMQAQMAMWAQMQQNPATAQLATQFAQMSLNPHGPPPYQQDPSRPSIKEDGNGADSKKETDTGAPNTSASK